MKVVMLAISMALALGATATVRPILIVNEDNDHYFKLDASLMNEASLKAYVDGIAAGGRVTHLFFCVAGQRASYDSKVWEPIWKGLGGNGWKGTPENNIWCENAKRLFDAGIDPYRVWIERAREKNISPWLSLRVNDAHGTTISNHFRVTSVYWAHPEWARVPGSKSANWYDHALDFGQAAVRDYTLAMAEEILTRYRPDGFELDFMRVNAYFRDGEVERGVPLMNEFVRKVRLLARREGVKLSVRVPDSIEACEMIGLDVMTWCREGLVDLVVPCNYYYSMTFALPFSDWKRRIAEENPSVRVIPGTGENVAFDSRGFSRADSAAYRGWASSMYSQGAEGLYLFNVAYHPWENERERDLDHKIYATDLLDPVALKTRARRFVRSFRDLHGVDLQHPDVPAVKSGESLTVILPKTGVAGGAADVVLGFRGEKTSPTSVSVAVNDVDAVAPRNVFESHKFGNSRAAFAWRVPTSVLKAGANFVRVTFGADVDLTWCEFVTSGDR